MEQIKWMEAKMEHQMAIINLTMRNCVIFVVTQRRTLYSYLAVILHAANVFKFISRIGKS